MKLLYFFLSALFLSPLPLSLSLALSRSCSMSYPSMQGPPVGSSVVAGPPPQPDPVIKEKIFQLVLELQNPELRESALLELSKKREVCVYYNWYYIIKQYINLKPNIICLDFVIGTAGPSSYSLALIWHYVYPTTRDRRDLSTPHPACTYSSRVESSL